jgi:hypothetical protein
MNKDIARLSQELRRLVHEEQQDQVSIMVETGEDEAIMVGTPDAYLRLVSEIVDAVNDCIVGKGKVVAFNGPPLPCTAFGNALDHDAHVVVRTLCLASNDEQKNGAVGYLKSLDEPWLSGTQENESC